MKDIITCIALVSSLCCAAPCAAQQHPARSAESPLHPIADTDTAHAVKYLSENAPSAFNIPSMPRFAIFGKEHKFYLGIGGSLKATAGFDFGNPISNPNAFTTSAIPMQREEGDGARFQICAQQSSFFVNFVALPGNSNQIGAYVSFNLINPGYTPMLTNAYLTWRGVKAGYGFSLFTDAGAVSPTIDYEGPNAATAAYSTILNYEKTFGRQRNWKVAVGMEMPVNSFTNTELTRTVTQRVPDIPMYLQYSWADGSGWLRLSALIRNLYYRDCVTGRNIDKIGWGLKLSGSTPVAGGLTAYYQAVAGKGVASYIQDLTGEGMDLMPSSHNEAVLDPVKVWGAYLGLQYTFSPKVFCSATYSHVRAYARRYAGGDTAWPDQYRYGQYLVGNVFYNINSLLQWGVEYLWGRRVDMSGLSRHDNRIQTMLQLSF